MKSSRLLRGRFSTTTGTAGLPVRNAWPPDDPHRELHCRRRTGRIWRPSSPDGGGLKSLRHLSQGSLVCTSGAHALFPKASQLLDEVFSPALKRIPLPDPPRTHFIIAGDSSLAMVKRFGRTVTHKGTFESALRQEVAKDPRILGLSFHMS